MVLKVMNHFLVYALVVLILNSDAIYLLTCLNNGYLTINFSECLYWPELMLMM